jgi:hypothetical protein
MSRLALGAWYTAARGALRAVAAGPVPSFQAAAPEPATVLTAQSAGEGEGEGVGAGEVVPVEEGVAPGEREKEGVGLGLGLAKARQARDAQPGAPAARWPPPKAPAA